MTSDDETKRREYDRSWEADQRALAARRGANNHSSDPWNSVREFHREDKLMLVVVIVLALASLGLVLGGVL